MEWKEDQYTKMWFRNLADRTKKNYSEQFPKFLDFVKQTPTQIIESRREQILSKDEAVKRFWEDQLIAFKNSLQGGNMRIGTVKSYLRTVMSFFSQNHYPLTFAKKELEVQPTAKDMVIKEWIPTNEEVRQLYRMTRDARDRSILLVLYQSGFSEVDVCAMNIEDFNLYNNKGEWIAKDHQYVARLREKTNILQQTCLSVEVLDDLKVYLQTRGFPKEGPLFLGIQQERITVQAINDTIRLCVTKAYNGRIKEWMTKHLRDAYMNGLLKAKLPQEVKDAMVGHKRLGARAEYGLTEETILEAYKESFKFLTVNGFGSQNRKIEEIAEEQQSILGKMVELRQDLGRTAALLEVIVKDILTEDQKAKLKELSKKIGGESYPI